MNDYLKMGKYLRSLTKDEFVEFGRSLGWEIHDFGPETIQVGSEVIRSPMWSDPSPFHSWRAQRTKIMLDCKHGSPQEWERACEVAGIDTDSATSLRIARTAQWLSLLAILIALGALAVSTSVAIWKQPSP